MSGRQHCYGMSKGVTRGNHEVNKDASERHIGPNGPCDSRPLAVLLNLIAQSEEVGGQHHRDDHDGQQHMGNQDDEVDRPYGSFFAKRGAFRSDVVAHVTQQKHGT